MRISDWSSDVCSSDLERRSDDRSARHHGDGCPSLDVRRARDHPNARHARKASGPTQIYPYHPFAGHAGRRGPHRLRRYRRRSEEHTSELQSLMRISYAVFCLKKKNIPHYQSKTVRNYTTHSYTNLQAARTENKYIIVHTSTATHQ